MKPYMVVLQARGGEQRTDLTEVPDYLVLKAALNGGMLQLVPYFRRYNGSPCVAFCDEEGKIKKLPVNLKANTEWVEQIGLIDDVLVGPIVIVCGNDKFLDKL